MQRTLFGGYSDNCCAFCELHGRPMTVKQMKKKECLKKQCYHLRKNEEHSIWQQRDSMRKTRKKRKLALNNI